MSYDHLRPYVIKAFEDVLRPNIHYYLNYINDAHFVLATEDIIRKYNDLVGNEPECDLESVGEICYLTYMGEPIKIADFLKLSYKAEQDIEFYTRKGLKQMFEDFYVEGMFHASLDMSERDFYEIILYAILLKKNSPEETQPVMMNLSIQ